MKNTLPAISELKRLLSLTSPILMAQLVQVLIMTVDTIMAGHYSAQDLSGIAIGSSVWFPLLFFVFGMLSALTPTVAQLHGGNKYGEVARNVYQSGYLSLMLVPFLASIFFALDPILRFIGADDTIRPIATHYLYAMALGLPAIMLFNVLRFYSDGLSLTKPALIASTVGLLVNAPLNYILIYGKLGLPAMGGVGCGVASAIVFYVSLVVMVFIIACKKSYRPFSLFERFYGIHWPTLKSLFKLGLPIGFAHFIEASMFGVIALFLAALGTTVVAAHQITLNVTALVFMVPMSLSMALTIRVGFFVGSGQFQSARFTALLGLLTAATYAIVGGCLLFVFRGPIARLYTQEPAVIELASTLLIIAAAFQLGDTLQATAAGALRGYKDTRTAMMVMLLAFWCLGLPLGYILGLTDWIVNPMQALGFWFGILVGLMFASALLLWRLMVISKATVVN